MTRENKLALVIGFALILMVGILISDHFSTARNDAAADLRDRRPSDPLMRPTSDAMLVDLRTPAEHLPQEQPATADLRRDERERNGLRPGPLAMNTGQPPGLEDMFVPVTEPEPVPLREINRIIIGGERPAQPHDSDVTFHNVRPGESLGSIAHRHYGDRTLASALARFNGLSDPDLVRIDHRLRIPPRSALGGEPASTPAPAPAVRHAERPQYKTYTIKPGDNLSEISQQLLGTSRRWREIYELNTNLIRDPDNVPAGVTIRIPHM
jgi:nucleoid-associated protein YgaU